MEEIQEIQLSNHLDVLSYQVLQTLSLSIVQPRRSQLGHWSWAPLGKEEMLQPQKSHTNILQLVALQKCWVQH